MVHLKRVDYFCERYTSVSILPPLELCGVYHRNELFRGLRIGPVYDLGDGLDHRV